MTDRDKRVLLVASGDSRLSANQTCWETQKQMELYGNNIPYRE